MLTAAAEAGRTGLGLCLVRLSAFGRLLILITRVYKVVLPCALHHALLVV